MKEEGGREKESKEITLSKMLRWREMKSGRRKTRKGQEVKMEGDEEWEEKDEKRTGKRM